MKVQNEMSTRISVETVSAIGSLSAFRNAIKATSNAWRAQETALKNSGDYSAAVRQKLSGLNQVMELQRAKIRELRQEQEGLDTSNKKQGAQFLRLEKQISQANRQLASYEGQARRARSAATYQVSGLAALQKSYRSAESSSRAYVNRLNAEGKSASATVERFRALRSSLTNLESQYRKQEFILKQVANESGRDSDAYRKQKEQLDKTATSIAKTKTEMKGLQGEVSRLQPTGIKRVDDAVIKIENHSAQMRSKVSSAFSRIKENALGVAAAIGTVGVALGRGAQQATNLQDSYKRTSNLLITGGEKASEAIKNVSKMQSDGAKMSVRYGISQQKIASAYQELTKRGYTSSQSLGAMKTMLQASVASGDDLNDVVTSSTAAMEAFGLRANGTAAMLRNTKKAVNEMAYAADMTATDFKSMSVAMEYAGPAAKTLGYSVGQTASAIGVLSNNGLEADKAGTGLRQVMNSLIKPTQGANEALKKIGLSTKDFTDKSGKMKSMSEIFGELNQHTKNLNDQQKGAVFKALFGATGESAGITLANNSKQLEKLNKDVENSYKGQGYVQQLANKNMGSAKMAMSQFKEAANATTITLGKALLPALRDSAVAMAKAFNSKDGQQSLKALAKVIGTVAMALTKLIVLMSKHTTTVKVFGGALLSAFSAFKVLQGYGAVKDTLSRFPKTMLLIKNSILGVKDALKVATAGWNPWVIGIELAVAAIVLLYKHSKTFRKICSDMGKLAAKAGKAIVKGFNAVLRWAKSDWKQIALLLVNPLAGAFALLYKHNKKFRTFINGLGKSARSGLKKVGNYFKTSFNNIGKTISKYNKQQKRQQQANQKAWNDSSKKIRKTASNMWKSITKTTKTAWNNQIKQNKRGLRDARTTWNTMSRNVSRTSKAMWRRASRDARNGWNYVARWGNRSSKSVARTWDWMNRQTTRVAQRMFRRHKQTFRAGYKVIEDQTRTWQDLTSGHWDRLADDTERTARDMGKFHQRIFRDMYNKLNQMTDGRLGDMLKTWQSIFGSIQDAVGNAVGAVHRKFVDLVKGVLSPFKTMIDDIKNGINWVLDKLGATKLGGNFSITMPSYAAGTKDTHPGGFAKVNDGQTGHYRELYRLPNGTVGMFPAVRNMVVPLPKGTSILDGERSYMLMRMMGKVPHYANGIGALSDMFSNIVNSAGDALDGMMEDVDKIMSHPIEFMESVFKKFVRVSTPVKFASDLVTYVPKFIAKQMGKWIKKQFATLTNPGGAGVERWRPYIIRAFKQLGYEPAAWKVAKLLRQIQTESGGNPLAFQHGYVDANTGGNEARGLLQFAGSTWRADALPGHTDWKNGYNEILAAINVLEHGGEGGWGNVGNGHGWENGGLINKHGMYEVGEYNRPEMIIPLDSSKRSRAYQLLGEIVARFHAEEPNHSAQTVNNDDHKLLVAMNDKFDQLLTMFNQLLGATSDQTQAIQDQGVLDPKGLYKKMARDRAMRQFG